MVYDIREMTCVNERGFFFAVESKKGVIVACALPCADVGKEPNCL